MEQYGSAMEMIFGTHMRVEMSKTKTKVITVDLTPVGEWNGMRVDDIPKDHFRPCQADCAGKQGIYNPRGRHVQILARYLDVPIRSTTSRSSIGC